MGERTAASAGPRSSSGRQAGGRPPAPAATGSDPGALADADSGHRRAPLRLPRAGGRARPPPLHLPADGRRRPAAARDRHRRRGRRARHAWRASCGTGSPARAPEPLRRTGRCLRVRTGHHLPAARRRAPGAARAAGDGLRRDGARPPGGPRDPRPDARPRRQGASCTPWRPARSSRPAGSPSSPSSPRERPVVVLVEDLHWAQEPLLDLLERVLDDVGRAAARGRDRQARAGHEASSLGTPPGRVHDLARAALAGRLGASAGHPARERGSAGAAAGRARAGRGQSVLPRGAARCACTTAPSRSSTTSRTRCKPSSPPASTCCRRSTRRRSRRRR